MTTAFPSETFFRALQRLMAEQRHRFRVLGYFDVVFGVHVLPERAGESEQRFVLAFDVFDCVRADAVARFEPDIDFILEGTGSIWREMLQNIKQRGAADVAHSINTLTHFGDALRIRYDDPDRHDKLFRFAESIQEFFNLAAHVDLELADGAGGAGARPA
jgi:hypothetical protein